MNDPYAGQGGSYAIDPTTGVRTLIERTTDANEQQQPAPADPVAEIVTTTEKE